MGHFIKIKSLNDIVDTLKLHFYPNTNITLEEIEILNQNITDFVELKKEAMQIKNQDNQKRFVNTTFANHKFRVMAVSQSSFNVVLQNGDISISLLKYSNRHSNPLIKVEFRAEFLLRSGYKNAIQYVKNIINNLFENYFIKVSEIHLAKDIQGYEFNPFDIHRFKTLSKHKTVFHNDINSEFYFGNKFSGFSIGRGAEMLRVYNKTLEISQKKEKSFIQVLSWNYNPDFDNTQNVWRLEFQLRRERLKELLGKDGLLDSLDNVINSISNLWTYCLERFVFKHLSNDQVHEQVTGYRYNKDSSIEILNPETLRKRFQRANLHIVWESIRTFEDKQAPTLQRIKDIKKPESEYVKNSIKSVISTFIKLNKGHFDSQDLTQIFIDADNECKEKHGVSMIDKARINALDYIVNANVFYEENGLIQYGFHKYKKDFVNNLHDTFALVQNEPSNFYTFQEFQKRLSKL
ncbi:hypothetical protein CRV02_08325 [Arcobacter sp. CECT 8989]|nr:hypothetical protein [Arcobacter sp. CECT 8989]RXK01505.1 hypothetical protein CRV02_08325 [Arcobacter sp. CECT 8989]